MRIAMVSKAVIVGAYQRKLEELARLPGVELTAIVPPAWRDSRGETRLERVYTNGYRLVETPLALNGHFHTHFYPQLGAELARAAPDLVHIDEEPYNLAAWQSMRWAVRRHVPGIFFTWQNLDRRYPPPFAWMEQYNYRHAAHALAGNHEAAAVLRSKGFRGPVSVVPQFGVDPEIFCTGPRPPMFPRPQDASLVVGYAGGLIPEKGVDTLIRAIAQCNHRLAGLPATTSPACHLVIAGTGAQQPALEELAAALGLDDRVTFLGRVGSTGMPAFYNGIDVLVLPSRTTPAWKEQFGRVLVEAMACGLPVVGSDSGEIPNVISDAGRIFPEEDVSALADCLAQLAQDPALRVELGERGRARVLTNYTHRQIAAAIYEVYRTIATA